MHATYTQSLRGIFAMITYQENTYHGWHTRHRTCKAQRMPPTQFATWQVDVLYRPPSYHMSRPAARALPNRAGFGSSRPPQMNRGRTTTTSHPPGWFIARACRALMRALGRVHVHAVDACAHTRVRCVRKHTRVRAVRAMRALPFARPHALSLSMDRTSERGLGDSRLP